MVKVTAVSLGAVGVLVLIGMSLGLSPDRQTATPEVGTAKMALPDPTDAQDPAPAGTPAPGTPSATGPSPDRPDPSIGIHWMLAVSRHWEVARLVRPGGAVACDAIAVASDGTVVSVDPSEGLLRITPGSAETRARISGAGVIEVAVGTRQWQEAPRPDGADAILSLGSAFVSTWAAATQMAVAYGPDGAPDHTLPLIGTSDARALATACPEEAPDGAVGRQS